jgi:CheY-like chemotaxis protein
MLPRSFPFVKTDYSRVETALGTVILLVEDNPPDVMLIHEALADQGMKPQLFVATDGAEAIRILDQIDGSAVPCPELVVLDINLPKVPGFEVLTRIRASPRCASIPVVIFTSSDARNDRQEAARRGATAYILKPNNLEEFPLIAAQLKKLLSV